MSNEELQIDASDYEGDVFSDDLEFDLDEDLETDAIDTLSEEGDSVDSYQTIFAVAPQVILAAASIIRPEATVINIIATIGGGAVTLTSNPSIADGINGQLLVLRGSSATDTITLTDGNGMLLAGDVTLGLNDTITLYYDGLITNDWVELARNLNTVQTYAATNVTTDRAYDADTVVVAELADVVGTLIADLRAWGIVK